MYYEYLIMSYDVLKLTSAITVSAAVAVIAPCCVTCEQGEGGPVKNSHIQGAPKRSPTIYC